MPILRKSPRYQQSGDSLYKSFEIHYDQKGILIFLYRLPRGGSRVRPLMQMTKSYFFPMKC